jgi:hypothetical protein
MKYLTMAIALVIAAPAAAQTAPAPNSGHDQHQQHQPQAGHHGQHQQSEHQQSGHQQDGHQQSGHQQHGEGCCADRNENGRMDCCEQAEGAEARACCDEHQRQGEHSDH